MYQFADISNEETVDYTIDFQDQLGHQNGFRNDNIFQNYNFTGCLQKFNSMEEQSMEQANNPLQITEIEIIRRKGLNNNFKTHVVEKVCDGRLFCERDYPRTPAYSVINEDIETGYGQNLDIHEYLTECDWPMYQIGMHECDDEMKGQIDSEIQIRDMLMNQSKFGKDSRCGFWGFLELVAGFCGDVEDLGVISRKTNFRIF